MKVQSYDIAKAEVFATLVPKTGERYRYTDEGGHGTEVHVTACGPRGGATSDANGKREEVVVRYNRHGAVLVLRSTMALSAWWKLLREGSLKRVIR